MDLKSRYDVVVIGAGHNGLVAAAYLARAGRSVLVLERRHLVGGACITEEPFPGYKFSTAAYVVSLFRPRIIRELKLHQYGYDVIPRDPSSFSPFPDGAYLMMGSDSEMNLREIAKFSRRDADRFADYEAFLDRISKAVEPMLDGPPPDPTGLNFSAIKDGLHLARTLKQSGVGLADVFKMVTRPAGDVLDDWFESDGLKATLATDAIIGAMASPSTPGTAYVLLHHVMGETNGRRGVWGYVRGGMGSLTKALAAAAGDLGVDILCEADVSRITIESGRVTGVQLADGRAVLADAVASSADAHVTFCRLLKPEDLPPPFLQDIQQIRYDSASMKINLALSELPDFTACPGRSPGPQHQGTIHISPTMDYIERAFDDARRGRPSANPILECTVPSVVDNSLAPPGKHVMSIFVQYAPYSLADADWDDIKETFADRCVDVLTEAAPNFKNSILYRQVISPLDLERDFALTGGNIFQGAMTLHQLGPARPVWGWSRYRTPIRGLYLCGAAAHPGGGVMGACGRNAALAMNKDR